MFTWLTDPRVLAGGFLLAMIQLVAALPWLRAIDPKGFVRTVRSGNMLLAAAGLAVATAWFIGYKGEAASLKFYGRLYGAVLHLQLLIDLFILFPQFLAVVWPKGGAVALAAYREGWRNPMFWLIGSFAVILTWVAVVLPYFTFGDDFKMMKQIGFDIVMLAAALFGVLLAALSISDEIEGRTAITVMSKPINRRQFLLGKFAGILMACGAMSLLVAWNLGFALWVMPEFDPINKDRAFDPMPDKARTVLVPLVTQVLPLGPTSTVGEGAATWAGESFVYAAHVTWGFGQVMILVAVACALATRLAFVANVVVCLVVYFLGHLAPVVVRVTDGMKDTGGAAVGLVRFLGNLFDTVLPPLEFYNQGPAIIRETPIELVPFLGYVATVFGCAAIYTAVALIVGLLLFEDRDLA